MGVNKDILKISKSIFYLVLTLGMIIFTVNYAFTDWESVGDDIESAVEDLTKLMDCKIVYKTNDMYFSHDGLCLDEQRQEIFLFLNNTK